MKWPNFLLPFADLAQLTNAPAPAKRAAVKLRGAEETIERSIALAGRQVDYKLVRRRGRRGVGLKIDGSGMTVAASLTTPVAVIEDMIGKNEQWVIKKLGEWSQRRVTPQRWETGAHLSFMGETLTLMVDLGATKTHVERAQSHLFVHLKSNATEPEQLAHLVEAAVIAWYKKQALPHLAQRAFFYSKLYALTPPRVFLSSANGRWGSCNSKREVRFSWRLIKARPALIDYVVCHELSHLRHMNHSAQFWKEVEQMCPEYEIFKRELDQNDHRFRAF